MKKKRRSAYLLESLEARLLFSADLAPLPVDGGTSGAEFESDLEISLQPDSAGVQEADENTQERQEVIFVDSGVDDYQQLIDDIESQLEKGRPFDIVNLESDSDGIDQISAYLKQHEEIDAVHVVSHGSKDAVKLGNVWLTPDKLDAYADAIEGWQQTLSSDADLLFYGCNLAAGEGGQDLVDSLTLLTGADVAASDDVTGSAKLGGDWDLEYSRGAIETAVAFSPEVQQNWNEVLTTFIVNTTTDTIDNNLGDGIAEDAAGNTSLRAAIMEANALGGAHDIFLNPGTYTLSLGELEITSDLTINGADARTTLIDGNGSDRVFKIDNNSTATLNGITIMNGNQNNSGGVFINGGSTLYLSDAIVRDNTSDRGGGMHVHGTANLERVLLYNNTANEGGAIHFHGADGGSLINVTISGNDATSRGGGLWTDSVITVTNCTITLNDAPNGGGIVNSGGTVNISNTIVAENLASSDPDVQGTFNSQDNNLIGDEGGATGFTDGVNGDQVGTTGSPIDPLLGSLQDNGGFTRTHALLAGSPGIDPAGLSGAPPYDQRGFVRDVTPDIGAFEYNGANTAPTLTVTGAVTVKKGTVYTLNLSASDPDSHTITSWTINWGDGTIETIPGNPSSVTHTYTQAGFTYNITVSATDVTGTYIAGDLISTSMQNDSLYWFDANTGLVNHIENLPGNNPIDAQFGPDGEIYVTAFASNKIYRYNADGSFDTTFVDGSGLTGPSRIAFGPDGNLYVTNMFTNEVLRFSGVDGTSTGTAMGAFISTGLDEPDGITFGPDGNLYVANKGTGNVLRFDGVTGTLDPTFLANGPSGFDGYMDIQFGPDGRLWVTNQFSDDIRRYSATDGAYVDTFASTGATDFAGIAFGPDGYVYLSDAMAEDKIIRYPIGDGSAPEPFVLSGTGGLDQPVNIVFTPAHQVKVVANYAPTASGTYTMASTDEDTTSAAVQVSAILSDASITANDVDGDTLGIAVFAQTGLGTWQYSTDGVGGWTAFGIISPNAALLLSETTWLRYVPDGMNAESVGFDFRAWDQSTDLPSINGTPRFGNTTPGGGTTAYSTGNASVALTVSSVNDAPTATNLTSTSAYNEGDASVDITDIMVSDVDSGETITATLTLNDTTTGSLSANDGATYDGLTGVWTITGTVANVNLALANLVFTPLVDNDVDTTITTHIEDAAGAGPADGTITLDVTPANDAPTATNLTSTSMYNEGDATVAITNIVVSDVDSGETITATLTLNDISTGSLSANDGATYDGLTGVWTITDTVANVNLALANLVFTPLADNDVDTTITTHIEDAAGVGPADGTITLDVTPANDAPTATNLTTTSSYNEGDATVAITDIVVTDVDSGEMITATLTLNDTTTGSLSANDGATYNGGTGIWTITDTVANVNVALANLVFNPNSDNDVDTTITTHIEDAAGAGPADGTITLDVTPANDAPTATNLTSTSAYNEGDSPVAITDIVVTDVDSGEMITATLTLNDTTTGSLSANDGATYDGLTGVWTITDTVANVNLALANLVFTPLVDNDVDTTITTHIEDAAGVGPADGTITLDVTPANDAPTATNLTTTSSYNEGDATVAITDIVVTDVDSGEMITATLTLNDTTTGSLSANDGATYNGGTGIWTITDTVANVNVALANLVFNPNSDNDVDTTITTHIEDAAGAGPADGTITLDVTPANDAPTASNLTSTSPYNEGDATVAITDIVVTDVDSGEMITATLTLNDFTTGSLSANDGASYDGGTGVWTITGTVANVNLALANLVFTPLADNDVDTTITTHIEDAAGAGPADGTITLDVTPANDAPTASNLTSTSPYNEGDATVAITDIVVTDVDSGETITATLTLNDYTTGSLSANDGATYDGLTGVWTITDTVANVNVALANLVFTPLVNNDVDTTISTHIEDAAGAGPADGTITLDVTPANDAPTATNLTTTSPYNEGDATVAITDIVVTDVDSGETITATLTLNDFTTGSLSANDGATYDGLTGVWTITGTVANVNLALANLVFTPLVDNDVDTTIATHIQDAAGAGPADGTITLDVTPANDAPTATNLTSTSAYNEGDATVAITDIVVTDVDSGETITATLTLNDFTTGSLSANDGATYDGLTGVWTITGTVANVNLALANLVFTPLVDNDVDTTITTHIQDAAGAGPADGTITLDVTPANDAPTATNLTSTSAYNEGDATVAITDIVVTDVDSGETITATLTLNDISTGSLSANDGATYDGLTGVWTITGTVANVNLALANLVFTPLVDNDVDTTITTHIEDAAGAGPADGTITLDVTPANDAPTATNLTTTSPYNEGDATVAITDIVVTDVDSGETITATLTLNDYTTGSLSANDGATYNGLTGVWTITGTVANVNLALANLVFTPLADNDVDTTITTHIEDAAGAGPADGTITLDVTPANDAPTASNLTSTSPYNEGDATVAITDIVVSDVDSGETITATLTLNDISTGSLSANDGATYDGLTGVWTITGTVANVNLALANLVFTPLVNNDVDTTIATHIQDAAGAGPADGTITLDVTPANDAPTATNLTTTSPYNEGDATVAITDIVVSDVDSGETITATLTLNDISTGSLSANDGASYNGLTGVWTITDTVANVNLALANLVFTPNSDNDVDTTITTHIEDAAGAGPADGTITLDVTPANDAPTASNLTSTSPYNEGDATVAITDIVVTDVDSGETITATLTLNDISTGSLSANDGATYDGLTGVWTITGTVANVNLALANLVFTPLVNNDVDTTITTHIEDAAGAGPADGTITLDVTPANDAPVINNATFSVDENSTNGTAVGTVPVTDPDADDTHVYSIPAGNTGSAFAIDNVGNITVANSAALNFETTPVFTLTVRVQDQGGTGLIDTATITVNLNDINDAGTVTIDNTTPAQGDTLTANVIDPDGASGVITYQWFSDGVVIGGANGKTYTTTQTDVGAVMTVTAIYTDDQSTAESLTSAPTAPVTNVNDTPIALNDNLNATEDQSMTFTSVTDLLGNDSDIDGDTLTISSFSQPANGSLADNGDGTVTYTSAGNFSGVDNFTYTISDNKGGTASGAAIIVVTPVGDTPQVTNVSTDAGVQSGLINIDRNANDGAEVTHFKISGITNGTLYLADGVSRIDNGDFITVGQGQAGLRFTPAANSTADGSFNVESSEDGVLVASQSDIATSIISILTTAPQPSEPVPSPTPSDPEEVISEETEQEENEELEDVADETDVPAIADDMASVEAPQNAKAPGLKKASMVPGISVFRQADLNSNNDRIPGRSTFLSPQTLKKLVESENLGELKTALRKLDITTLPPDVYELVRGSLDAVQEEMGKEILIGKTVVGSAIATSVGLSAGYVVWMLKGGSLLASVLSSLPAWQLADPLAILVGKIEDEEEEEEDDTLETIIKDGSRRNKDKESKASESDKHKKESTKR